MGLEYMVLLPMILPVYHLCTKSSLNQVQTTDCSAIEVYFIEATRLRSLHPARLRWHY